MNITSFKEYLQEDAQTTPFDDLKDSVEAYYKSKFPHGAVGFSNGVLGGTNSLFITFLLSEKINVAVGNDKAHTTLMITPKGDGSYVAEKTKGGLCVNPPPKSFMAMEVIKFPYRKTTGNLKKIETSIKALIDVMLKTVKDNKDNIYRKDDIESKYWDL